MRIITILIMLLLLFSSCANKSAKKGSDEVYDKSDRYWYSQIIRDIKVNDLDKADESFTSLASEHVASPLLKEAMMILAKAHMKEEEYLMANYYIDEYIKRYGSQNNIDYLTYLKIKSNFLSFKKINRDQKLLLDTMAQAKNFINEYPNSPFLPEVETILTRLKSAEYLLNRNIVELYKKTGKLKAAKIYQEKLEKSWLKGIEIVEPKSLF